MQIKIGQGQGITQAIKTQIQADGGRITNNNLSIWQQVMTEVKTVNDARDEGKKPFYTGGDDVSKIGDSSTWHTDFKTNTGQVIELASNVWNKIVQLLTGKTPVAEEQPPVPETVPEQISAKQPDSAPVINDVPEVLDETQNNEQPVAVKSPQDELEKANEDYAQALSNPKNWNTVTLEQPVAPPMLDAPKPTPKPIPQGEDNKASTYTKEEVENMIANLKPGEKFKYQAKSSFSGDNLRFSESKPVLWTRQQDNTLIKSELSFDGKLNTHYEADGKTLISKQAPLYGFTLKNRKHLISTTHYKTGKPVYNDLDLTGVDMDKTNFAFSYDAGIKFLNIMKKGQQTYSSQIYNDNKGEVLVKLENGKYFDKKGKEIDAAKAEKIIAKAFDKNQMGHFIQNY